MLIEIKNKKIVDNLSKKEALAKDNLEILQEMEKLEKKVNSNGTKIKMLDEKIRPKILDEALKEDLGEYEELVRVFNDKGKWTMEFIDRMEEFKTNWNKRNEDTPNK